MPKEFARGNEPAGTDEGATHCADPRVDPAPPPRRRPRYRGCLPPGTALVARLGEADSGHRCGLRWRWLRVRLDVLRSSRHPDGAMGCRRTTSLGARGARRSRRHWWPHPCADCPRRPRTPGRGRPGAEGSWRMRPTKTSSRPAAVDGESGYWAAAWLVLHDDSRDGSPAAPARRPGSEGLAEFDDGRPRSVR